MSNLAEFPTWSVIAKGGVVPAWFVWFFVAERLAPAVRMSIGVEGERALPALLARPFRRRR